MDSLCISKALELHRIVSPYLPDMDGDDDAMDMVHQTVKNMRGENPQAYLDSVLLMSGKTLEELMVLDSNTILYLFIDGLVANQIIALNSFCNRLGVKHG